MIPRKYRLSGKKNIEQVKKEGKISQSANFGLIILERKDNVFSKLGLIVSKKISPQACQRNKVKRRIREVFRKFVLKLKPGYDLLLLAKPGLKEVKIPELEKELGQVLKKNGLIK